MHADVNGALRQIAYSYKAFEHNGNPMTKKEVIAVLTYAQIKGYTSTSELSDSEIDSVLTSLHKKR